jgi:tetratricopeptide (TPR) repeat protein
MSVPSDVDALIRDALVLLGKGEYQNALAKADQAFAAQQKPDDVKTVYFTILRRWASVIVEKDFPLLLTECRRLRPMADRSGTHLLVLLRIAIQIKNYPDAIGLYTDIPESDDAAAKGAYREMLVLYREKQADFDKMVNDWEGRLPVELAAGIIDKQTAIDQAQGLGALFCNQLEVFDKALGFFKIALSYQNPNVKALEGMAICYDGMEENQKSIDCLIERLESVDPLDPAKKPERAQYQFDIALQYDKSRQFYKALEEYKKVFDLDPGFVYAYQNIWLLYDYWGEYQAAREWWTKTVNLYQQQYAINGFAGEPDKLYYYADSLFYANRKKTPANFELIETLYKAYKEIKTDDTDAYIALTRFYLEKRRSVREGDCYNDLQEAPRATMLSETQAALLANFGRGVELLNERLSGKPKFALDKGPLNDLGDLYLAFGYYTESLARFQAGLELDDTDGRAQTGVGVCQFKLGKYPEAIGMFKKVLEASPDDLNIQCNLADATRKAGNLAAAGELYTKILDKAPNYTDAVVGVGECYKSTGDQSLEKKDNEEAAELFGRAKRYFKMAFDNDTVQQASRFLNATELNALHYSLGYTDVRLFESNPTPFSTLLRDAKTEFEAVPKTSEEYLKAQSAIKAINKRKSVLRKVATWPEKSIYTIALLLFLGAQVVAIYGWFATTTVYHVDRKAVKDYIEGIAGQGQATELFKKTAPIYGLEFPNKEKLESKLDSLLPDSVAARMPIDNLAVASTVSGQREISPTTYSLFTFGTLFFMIVGLFLPAITKLKVGELELDKNAVDTVKTTPEILVNTKPAAG